MESFPCHFCGLADNVLSRALEWMESVAKDQEWHFYESLKLYYCCLYSPVTERSLLEEKSSQISWNNHYFRPWQDLFSTPVRKKQRKTHVKALEAKCPFKKQRRIHKVLVRVAASQCFRASARLSGHLPRCWRKKKRSGGKGLKVCGMLTWFRYIC